MDFNNDAWYSKYNGSFIHFLTVWYGTYPNIKYYK
jgi:hypothetical protein